MKYFLSFLFLSCSSAPFICLLLFSCRTYSLLHFNISFWRIVFTCLRQIPRFFTDDEQKATADDQEDSSECANGCSGAGQPLANKQCPAAKERHEWWQKINGHRVFLLFLGVAMRGLNFECREAWQHPRINSRVCSAKPLL